jgi:phosphinothricin acetyltransferase
VILSSVQGRDFDHAAQPALEAVDSGLPSACLPPWRGRLGGLTVGGTHTDPEDDRGGERPATRRSLAWEHERCARQCDDGHRRGVTAVPIVRPARRSDLAELVAIHNYYVEQSVATFDTEATSVESRTAWFESFSNLGPHRLLVAVENQRVLGCASSAPYRAHPAFAQTVEVSIYVDPDVRTTGVGSALYNALFDELRHESLHSAVAGIALPNDASVALHRKFGFTEVGVFEEYATKHGRYISSLWMQRRL